MGLQPIQLVGQPLGLRRPRRPPRRVLERAEDHFGVTLKRRRLPQFDVAGEPLFIIVRLWGSLPSSRHFPASNLTSGEAFLTMDCLLDQARCGPTFLKQPAIAELVLAALQYGSELKHYILHSWVIMPNHVHLLLTAQVSVARLLNSLKSATAKRANLILQRTGQPFWQDESYDRLVRDRDEFQRIQPYIENNPVAAGLTGTPEQYPWSSKAACDAGPRGRPARGAAPPQSHGEQP